MRIGKLAFALLLLATGKQATTQTMVYVNQLFCYKPAEWLKLDKVSLGQGTGYFCTVSRQTAPTTRDVLWVISAGNAFPVPFGPGTNSAGFPEVIGSEVKALCLPGQFILSPPANGCLSQIPAVHF